MQTTTQQKAEVIKGILRAIAQTIQAEPLGVPAGIIYASLNAYGCSLQQYEQIERSFIDCKLVEKKNDLLFWIADKTNPVFN